METMQMVIYALAGIGVLALLYWLIAGRGGNQPFSGMKKQQMGDRSVNVTGDDLVTTTGDSNQINFKTKK